MIREIAIFYHGTDVLFGFGLTLQLLLTKHLVMRKLNNLFFFLLLPAITIAQPNMRDKYAQKFTEIGIQAGIAGYAGDLGGPLGNEGFRNFSPEFFRPMFNINATHRMAAWASFRPVITYGKIAGDDAILEEGSPSDPALGERNLSFRSTIAELSLLADINPLHIFNGYSGRDHKFYPYASIGVAAFYYNPQANLNGTWYDLKPLRLEGQGFPQYRENQQYSRVSISIPMGAGFKYYISPRHYIGAETMLRKTFTDYLDDVSSIYIDPAYFDAYLSAENAGLARELYNRGSRNPGIGGQRGNQKSDDYYFTVGLRFGFVLNQKPL